MMLSSGVGGRAATARNCNKSETRSSNRRCNGKAITVTYSDHVSVALVIQHAKGTHRILLSLCGLSAVAQWLRYCATNRKVAGSIPDGVIGIFH
jgi:hypothetical protein